MLRLPLCRKTKLCHNLVADGESSNLLALKCLRLAYYSLLHFHTSASVEMLHDAREIHCCQYELMQTSTKVKTTVFYHPICFTDILRR